MRQFFRNNGLSLVLMLFFALSLAGQLFASHRAYNDDQQEHGRPSVSLGEYLGWGHFWGAVGENWESEFLQMAMFVVLTCCLYQKGSPESKDPDEEHAPVDDDPRLG